MFFHMTSVHMLLIILPLGDLVRIPVIFKLCLCQSCRYLYQFSFTYSRVKTKRPNSRLTLSQPDLQVLGKCGAAASQVTVRQVIHELPYEDQITKQTKPNQTYSTNLQPTNLTYNL